jgi:hypothetical protein
MSLHQTQKILPFGKRLPLPTITEEELRSELRVLQFLLGGKGILEYEDVHPDYPDGIGVTTDSLFR